MSIIISICAFSRSAQNRPFLCNYYIMNTPAVNLWNYPNKPHRASKNYKINCAYSKKLTIFFKRRFETLKFFWVQTFLQKMEISTFWLKIFRVYFLMVLHDFLSSLALCLKFCQKPVKFKLFRTNRHPQDKLQLVIDW